MEELSLSRAKEKTTQGWINGLIGVLIFSGTLPATRVAVLEFDPVFVTTGRASIAGILAILTLVYFKEKLPSKKQITPLIIVAIGGVIGFPLLSSLALQHVTSAHSIVFVGILPVATAIFAILRGGERPKPIFWVFSILGSLLVIGYAVAQGISASPYSDILMFGAIAVCGLSYAEGAKLTKVLGGWQVISWALVIALPVMIPLSFIYGPTSIASISNEAWIALGYVSIFCMFVGYIFWYNGLAQGGTANVGQIQLLQPFFGLALASWLLHEKVSIGMIAVTVGVILCVAGTKKFAK